MTKRSEIGYIHIDYTVTDFGDLQTRVDIEGDIPKVVIIGLLEMAKDTVLHPPIEDDPEEYDGL